MRKYLQVRKKSLPLHPRLRKTVVLTKAESLQPETTAPPEDTESTSESVTEKTTEATQASAENVSADN